MLSINNKNRKFDWISGKTANQKVLQELDGKLSGFYSQPKGREAYQSMLEAVEEEIPKEGEFGYLLPKRIVDLGVASVAEIGCANGRIYRQLKTLGYFGRYAGVEVADYIIQQNKTRHPECSWHCAGAYNLPFNSAEFDIVFAYFVLEHLVYPEKALVEMLRTVKRGGRLLLVFPDFVTAKKLGSQELGFSPVLNAKQKLKKGRIIDALVSLYDSKIRLKLALNKLTERVGAFPLNKNLVCFNHPTVMSPDIDAVYIASKVEIEDWAVTNGYKVIYPYGRDGELRDKAFVEIIKL